MSGLIRDVKVVHNGSRVSFMYYNEVPAYIEAVLKQYHGLRIQKAIHLKLRDINGDNMEIMVFRAYPLYEEVFTIFGEAIDIEDWEDIVNLNSKDSEDAKGHS